MLVLLFTLSEYGQANTVLALAEELVSRENVQVHLCSFPEVQKRVDAIPTPTPSSSITFHPLKGPSFVRAAELHGMTSDWLPHPPSTKSSKVFKNMDYVFTMYSDEDYTSLIEEAKVVVKTLDADIIVVDTLCAFAVDACRVLDRRYIINNPTQAMDVVRMQQPWGKGFWYYPALSSGLPYPVPWKDFLLNIQILLIMIYTFATNPRMKALPASRKALGLKGGQPFMDAYYPDIDIICPAIEETDYPCVCPPNLHRFGTITVDTVPLEQSDPEMKAWLDKRKTVVIVLGTHAPCTEAMVRAFLRALLDYLPRDMQVLWKIRNKSDFEKLIEDMLGQGGEKEGGRFRIVDWITADPKAIMEHPNVACYVHHGGANSLFECCL
ncbi:hypothetical protein HGRIS_008473 [Hohenbuehelia grisea]|uniref:Uncharacterized protein n=1 Tax=Hohenbuehelia grisea TaxID=104357 RepID=A0ABR3J942_9AGAR